MEVLIGRQEERQIIDRCINDRKSHFIVVYGRRRVGKTFLIRQHFNNQFDFYVTGLANGDMKTQLTNFHLSLSKGENNTVRTIPHNWLEAFNRLAEKLEQSVSNKKVVFIDELPWMDTPRSKFLMGLEFFWNSWASARNDVILIGCGSAASWMINKLINNKGGLYNRVTRRIKLRPFVLAEVEKLMILRKYKIDRYQIIQLFMAFGGIPFYLNLIDIKLSVAQNIDKLCFSPNAQLNQEYNILFKSLFDNSEIHEQIIDALAQKRIGLTRKEILKDIDIKDGGGVTRILSELEVSDFIRKYRKFGNKSREELYQLIDPFTLFYHRHLKNFQQETAYWLNQINTPKRNAWEGNAFEIVCLLHIDKIKQSLGISGVQTNISAWWGDHAQIDLVIDRQDQVINLVEIKFSRDEFKITKEYDSTLRKKISSFQEATKTKKSLWMTMLTTYGLKDNMYAGNVQNVLMMDDIF